MSGTQATQQPATDSAVQPNPAIKLQLRQPHSLIKKLMEPSPKPDSYGYARYDHQPTLDVRVSKQHRKTALIVFDRLLKKAEHRGWHIELDSNHHTRGTYVVSDQVRSQIWIE